MLLRSNWSLLEDVQLSEIVFGDSAGKIFFLYHQKKSIMSCDVTVCWSDLRFNTHVIELVVILHRICQNCLSRTNTLWQIQRLFLSPIFTYTYMFLFLNKQLPGWFNQASYLATFIAYSNSALNPIIYGGFNQSFRDALCNIFQCHCNRRSSYPPSSE